MKSLRLRLILHLFVGLGVAWLVAALFTLLESREEINRLFDAQLAQSAQVLLGTTRHEIHERIEHGEDEIHVTHEYEQRLAFQIWNERDLLLRSSNAPVTPMTTKDGYSETIISGQAWRVLTKWDSKHEFMIQVAEPFAGRERLARHITLKMLMPTLAAVPVLALLIWFGIGAGLRPLNNLKYEVTKRAANQLEPLVMSDVPEEVAPLVKSLNDLFARLKEAFESERRFTADAAHELRTPLAALKIQAQVALRSTNEAERNAALEHVLHGVDRATRLVEQLLTLARVDPENASLDYKQVDLRSLAASIMADMEPLAHAKQIELRLESENACPVLGESTQLRLLLRNLLDNAIRYTPVGGHVSVNIHDDDGIKLQVRDTGLGIPEAEREQVLKRFYRITGSGEEGSGLGLSIVRRIAELHGASLILSDNDAGQGLLVSVHWPKK
ncbi:MAG: ATP-binding protein [Methylotenera sp.]|uniref:ATP-binding protein n=1 Tax=Methylotenera sp. TaxID=2051956 RepID=UPI00248A8504|nr:ATP-binding protein [Methylotenera sp.]MDI1309019.1 ATP-binding protein [Methylotenera sp.]